MIIPPNQLLGLSSKFYQTNFHLNLDILVGNLITFCCKPTKGRLKYHVSTFDVCESMTFQAQNTFVYQDALQHQVKSVS